MRRRKVTLTDMVLRALKPDQGGPKDVYDAKFSGGSFLCACLPDGQEELRSRVRVTRQAPAHHTGSYPELSLAAAREKARKTISKVDSGQDPVQEQRQREALPTP